MSPLPVLSGKEAVRVFVKLGWQVIRQHGCHIIPIKTGHIATLLVPNHKTIAPGTLRSLIRCSGSDVETFVETYRSL